MVQAADQRKHGEGGLCSAAAGLLQEAVRFPAEQGPSQLRHFLRPIRHPPQRHGLPNFSSLRLHSLARAVGEAFPGRQGFEGAKDIALGGISLTASTHLQVCSADFVHVVRCQEERHFLEDHLSCSKSFRGLETLSHQILLHQLKAWVYWIRRSVLLQNAVPEHEALLWHERCPRIKARMQKAYQPPSRGIKAKRFARLSVQLASNTLQVHRRPLRKSHLHTMNSVAARTSLSVPAKLAP
mmetsp:Transcript_26119/g.60491  ORF Transcript_26119/g.60491 Transcript_26119/m.60491 type:complete len:240 (-) Transcript_26119:17-736(-)